MRCCKTILQINQTWLKRSMNQWTILWKKCNIHIFLPPATKNQCTIFLSWKYENIIYIFCNFSFNSVKKYYWSGQINFLWYYNKWSLDICHLYSNALYVFAHLGITIYDNTAKMRKINTFSIHRVNDWNLIRILPWAFQKSTLYFFLTLFS